MSLAPVRLAPVFVPRIWGARSLAPLFDAPATPGADTSTSEPIGEVWLTGERCAFADGPFAGKTLGEVWPALPAEWTGTRLREQARIPLLVKFIFPEDKLSLQVHPDDAYARRHEAPNDTGKTEMWYALSAREGAELHLGFVPGITRERFKAALDQGTADECLQRFAVRAGDAFFVPAGTVHTIGPGMVLCEIQQHSDLTYRLSDYGRLQADGTRRPLHLQQAFDVLTFGPQRGTKIAAMNMRGGPLTQLLLASCPYFLAERWDFAGEIAASTSREQFELLIVLAGEGRIEWLAGSAEYESVGVWMLPAALGAYRLVPRSPTNLLRAYVPDLAELTRSMAAREIEPAALSRVFHS